MKRIFTLILFLLYQVSFAQNLVPNWSFEDSVSCPTGFSQIDKAVGWSSFRQTPEYFNSCNNTTVGVPLNYCGSQNALSGNAYAGFSNVPAGANLREFIGIQLSQSLDSGVRYFVSFYLSRAANSTNFINVAINKLGAKFSTVSYSTISPQPIDNYAQVYTDSIIQDSLNWIKISGSFIADSSYEYISIGNFFNDSITSYVLYDTIVGYAYYFLDCVCLSTDSLTCNNNVGIPETTPELLINVYPIPTSNNIIIEKNQMHI